MTENTTDQATTEKSPTPKRHFPWAGLGVVLLVFAFTIMSVAFYFSFVRIAAVNRHFARVMTDFRNKIETDQNTIAVLQKSINDAQQNIQQWHDEGVKQQELISNLMNTQRGSKDQWSVAEAQYLAKLAQDNLQVGNDLPLVIKLMQTADQELHDLTDPKLLTIRKALASDIAALQNVSSADLTGIYLQLSALNDQIDKLPLPNYRPLADQDTNAADHTHHLSWWRKGLQQSWRELNQLVVVRYNQSDTQPFIAPDEQRFLYQNCHALLAQAMLAVVQKQPDIYRASLQQANAWIKQYFLVDSPITSAVLKNLTTLQAINIKPDLPTISASLQAFRDYSATQQSA